MFLCFQPQASFLQPKNKSYALVAAHVCKAWLSNIFNKNNIFLHCKIHSHIWDAGNEQCTCTKNVFENICIIS